MTIRRVLVVWGGGGLRAPWYRRRRRVLVVWGGARRSGPMIGRMHPAAVVLIIALAILALDRLGLWAESRGWIYWRRRRPEASGAVLNPLVDVFQPGHVHVVEAQWDRDVLVRTDAAGAGRPDPESEPGLD